MKSTEKFLPKCLKPNVSKKNKFTWKKATEPFSKMLEAKKTNIPIEKITLFQESLKICIKKVYRTVFQNAWSQKNKHSYWKNNSVSKKRINSYEKGPPNRLPKCLKPKKTTLSLKKQFCSKKAYKFIWKKGHRTVFQNAWSQKNKHLHWKNNSISKNCINSYEKSHRTVFQNAWSKKTTLSLKKTFRSKKTYKFIWKKATEPSSNMPEAKKKQHSL